MSPIGGGRRGGQGRGGRPVRHDEDAEPSPEWLPVQQRQELEASRAANTPSSEQSSQSPQPPPIHQGSEGIQKVRSHQYGGGRKTRLRLLKGDHRQEAKTFSLVRIYFKQVD